MSIIVTLALLTQLSPQAPLQGDTVVLMPKGGSRVEAWSTPNLAGVSDCDLSVIPGVMGKVLDKFVIGRSGILTIVRLSDKREITVTSLSTELYIVTDLDRAKTIYREFGQSIAANKASTRKVKAKLDAKVFPRIARKYKLHPAVLSAILAAGQTNHW